MTTKNFDLVFVEHDYVAWRRINSIPCEFGSMLRAWLDGAGVVFSEGVMGLNWNQVLQSIRDDFHGFVEGGGWAFLQDSIEEGKELEDEDSEFDEK